MFFTAKLFSILFSALFFLSGAHAEQVQFPDEELATESVLPVFDQPQAVKNRLVNLAGRFELGIGGTYDLAEPFFSPYGITFSGAYNFTEEHGINVFFNNYLHGNTSYVDQLNHIPNSSNSAFNLQNAPAPSSIILVNYQYTAFYGKLSFAKEAVVNLSLFGFAGIGGYKIGDSLNPTIDVGLGQKFYFTPHQALRFDLRFDFYQGPEIVTGTIPATGSVSASSFSKRLYIGSLLSASYVYLF